MTGWKQDMVDLVDYAFSRLRSRLEGLSDEEYLWEPVPDCWTLHPDGAGRMEGDWVTPVWAPPFTTLGWRLGHVINCLLDPRYSSWLGLPARGPGPGSLPPTAALALEELERAFAVTRGHIEALSDASLGEVMGPIAGPWAADDKGAFVLHMVDELIHHSAEVALMRDLYRASQPANPVIDALLAGDAGRVESVVDRDSTAVDRARSLRPDLLLQACAEQRWSAVPLLVEHGFPLALPDGNSALHYAAAGGNLEVIAYLLDQGADRTRVDPLYRATPAAWADYFGQPEAAALLTSRDSQLT